MDGRLAQVVIPAKVIDEQPNHIIGAMYGMIVMEARQVRSGTGVGIHYVLWNARFPQMPVVSKDALADPRDSIPWLDLNIVIGADAGVFVAKWIEVGTGKTLVTSAFKIQPVEDPPASSSPPPSAANQNGQLESVNGST